MINLVWLKCTFSKHYVALLSLPEPQVTFADLPPQAGRLATVGLERSLSGDPALGRPRGQGPRRASLAEQGKGGDMGQLSTTKVKL